MTTRLHRTICLFTSAVMLMGVNGCRHQDCGSRSCRIGSHHESTYDHPATTYEYYGPGPGPMLPPAAPAAAESELPPPIPESELVPKPGAALIQPNTTSPVVPPAVLREPPEPASEDSPFKGAMRSARDKVSRLLQKPHTSSTQEPIRRSSSAAGSLRPFGSYPRQAAVRSARMSPLSTASQPAPLPAPRPFATVPPARQAAQTSRSSHDSVQDDFVSPWGSSSDSAADQESLDLAESDSVETDLIEIPDWPSVIARHPVTPRTEPVTRETNSARPIPVGTWVRISPRVRADEDDLTTEVDAGAANIPEPKRLEAAGTGPLLIAPKSE